MNQYVYFYWHVISLLLLLTMTDFHVFHFIIIWMIIYCDDTLDINDNVECNWGLSQLLLYLCLINWILCLLIYKESVNNTAILCIIFDDIKPCNICLSVYILLINIIYLIQLTIHLVEMITLFQLLTIQHCLSIIHYCYFYIFC